MPRHFGLKEKTVTPLARPSQPYETTRADGEQPLRQADAPQRSYEKPTIGEPYAADRPDYD